MTHKIELVDSARPISQSLPSQALWWFSSMASTMLFSQTHLLSLFLFFLLSHTSSDQQPTSPTALVLPVSKHPSTLQYTTTISQGTPLFPLTLPIDLNAPFLWLSCSSLTHNSSTLKPAQCHSPHCSLAHATTGCSHCLSRPRLLCTKNNTCIVLSENGFNGKVSPGELSEETLSLQSTNGLNPTSFVSVPRFLFLCTPQDFQPQGLAGLGLGPGRLGLPTRAADEFNFSRKFATCLPPSTDPATGVVFFGDGPYAFSPGIDVSKLLIFTPLILRPRSTTTHSSEYYIRVKSIRVNGKELPLNSTLLTKISTADPYAILETSVYKSLSRVFIEEALAKNVTRVAPVAPFDVCFSTKNGDGGINRPGMPVLDLVLQNERVFWRIFETNSMVPVGDGTACLGFLDGGSNPGASITIGGYQLEDNLLQFDLVSSRLGFTSSLLLRQTNCASFNFTSSGDY